LSKSYTISIVVPCYNEAANIEKLLAACTPLLLDDAVQIILVDNGSTDNTLQLLTTHIQKHKKSAQFKLVHVEKNIGYGNGIMQGLYAADADVLAWTHADLQTPLSDVMVGYHLLRNAPTHVVMVKGNRVKRKAFDRFFSRAMELYIQQQLGVKLAEINAQPKVFRRSFYEQIAKKAPVDFSLDLYFLYMAQKQGSIQQFDVAYLPRLAGEAKGGDGGLITKWKLARRTVKFVNELKKTLV
jgi:glycosyltransferase involved in cell wall biosynthesis